MYAGEQWVYGKRVPGACATNVQAVLSAMHRICDPVGQREHGISVEIGSTWTYESELGGTGIVDDRATPR
jgi:hypothetical protein